jgi:WD40 repeat protein
MCSK